jgi:putative intracellular protease/amidase
MRLARGYRARRAAPTLWPMKRRALVTLLALAGLPACGPARRLPKGTTTMPKRALIVVTSHDRKGDTGQPTGAYLSEITHPHEALRRAGVLVDFASPRGGRVPLDGVDRGDPVNAAFLDDEALMARLHNSLRPDQIEPGNYDAIFYAGGHGTMWDFADEPRLARVAAAIYERGGVVAAVCHGPAGLVNVKLSTGEWLVAGKEVAAFTNDEERAVGLAEIVPFLLADRLVERGARHRPAPNFKANVVVSERLVTGQNPASARGVGEKMVELLGG